MPKTSIIIPAFNASKYLIETIESVINGTFNDYEIIVIDDGSTDNTFELASQFKDKVRAIKQKNIGMSATRNRGIEESDSKYIALLDADDVWHPEKLALQTRLLDERNNYGLCHTGFIFWEGRTPISFPKNVDMTTDPDLTGWIYNKMLLTNYVLPSSALIRRSLVNEIGNFICEDQQTDDWEYFTRASTMTEFAKLFGNLVAYRQIPSSLSKKIRTTNVTEVMRSKLINKYGVSNPNGDPVDIDSLENRMYKSNKDFADSHLAHGNALIGLMEFKRLLLQHPHKASTTTTLIKSAIKRVLHIP